MTTPEQTLPPGDRIVCHESVHIDMRRRAMLKERERIIAWLRNDESWLSDIEDNGQCKHGSWSWEGCETCGRAGIASAIERGEHNE